MKNFNDMNSKEEILELLKTKMLTDKIEAMEYYQNLINAVESAIFDVPSVEVHGYSEYAMGFRDGINYILNYKKPETDDRA